MSAYAKPTIRPSTSAGIHLRNVAHDAGAVLLPTLAQVREAIAVPDDTLCVYLSGSVLAGWGHRFSDLDVFVVGRSRAEVDALFTIAHDVSLELRQVGALRWDIEYWREDEVDALVAQFEGEPGAYDDKDADMLYRLDRGRALLGEAWLAQRQQRLRASCFGRTLARRAVNKADNLLEDALGMLDSGDVESAMLAARLAFGKVTDALLHQQGDWCPSEKWRSRRLATAQPAALSHDVWWGVETMQDFDEGDPAAWVLETVRLCRDLILEVEVG